jgi:hypothetical protein
MTRWQYAAIHIEEASLNAFLHVMNPDGQHEVTQVELGKDRSQLLFTLLARLGEQGWELVGPFELSAKEGILSTRRTVFVAEHIYLKRPLSE